MDKRTFPKPDWSPLPNHNAVNIEGRVLLVDQRACVATLRFAPHARFDAHPAEWDIHVMCLEGHGWVMLDDETSEMSAGESVLWPRGKVHQLWTEDSSMTTLMVEHVYQNA